MCEACQPPRDYCSPYTEYLRARARANVAPRAEEESWVRGESDGEDASDIEDDDSAPGSEHDGDDEEGNNDGQEYAD